MAKKTKAEECSCCGEKLEDTMYGGTHYGDDGTAGAGEPFCESCYYESDAAATIYYGDLDEPREITGTRNDTEGDFRVRWHSTDPWRGYYELESDVYAMLFTDAILSGHESEAMLKELYDLVTEQLTEKGIGYVRAFCRTSNVFSTGLEIWVEKDIEKLMLAHMILMNAKKQVSYDDPMYSTGILMPRENLEKFRELLGDKYGIETDSDLMKLVEEKGESLVEELRERRSQSGGS